VGGGGGGGGGGGVVYDSKSSEIIAGLLKGWRKKGMKGTSRASD